MRLVHTSDWHLGKRLCEASLLDDQAYALDQIFHVCRDERADVLVIAGDVYDRAVPPVEAVALLSGFLERVARDLDIPVVAISGNHDSPERLGFGADLLQRGHVHLRTSLDRRAVPIVVESRRRKLHLYCLPYLEPEIARDRLGDPTLTDHDAAVRAAVEAMHADRRDRRAEEAVLVGHLFAAGGRESTESERPLVIGGAAHVGASALAGWTYVALGHLHAPQRVGGRDDVRYSGSLLKYSFGEVEQRKSVSLVETICGRAAVREVPLTPRRDLVRIEGGFDELLHDERFCAAEQAYVEASYTDTGYVLDAAERLRARFPHLLAALPRAVVQRALDAPTAVGGAGVRDARALLAGFWAHVEGGEQVPDDEQVGAFERAMEQVRRAGDEPCALAS